MFSLARPERSVLLAPAERLVAATGDAVVQSVYPTWAG